ncbi:J domain-containing protein [Desulfurispira natronophila]|uniref:J domain-containing protein n=1 Tax=Desulfurispira natronophila TaxID=682562 RepID=A0A7W7Y3K4_9BACT|nr:DnaJ domain-containing protein [Desulfurispira natronophila]MBB5021383.1 hypothetical protein [Desulfurispira natronophila]
MFRYARESKRLLGVDHTNSTAQIKAAFRTCVKKYHPDVLGNTPSSVRYFQNINRVYSELLQYKATAPQEPATNESRTRRTQRNTTDQKSSTNSYRSQSNSRTQNKRARTAQRSNADTREQAMLKKVQKIKKSSFSVDTVVAAMGVEALIMRCEFSDNYYVKREAIKALIHKGNSQGVQGILYLQKSGDTDAREIIEEILYASDGRFRRMMDEGEGKANPFFSWIGRLVNGIVRVFDSSVRPSTDP